MNKTYAEYVAEAKKRKFNPALMASPEAQLPSKLRERSPKRTETPPLDQVNTRRRAKR